MRDVRSRSVHGGLTGCTLVPTPRACSAQEGSAAEPTTWDQGGKQEPEVGKGDESHRSGSVRSGPRRSLARMEAGGHRCPPTCSSFIAAGKAGVSITSEASRFSKTAAAGRSSDSEWQSGLKGWARGPSKGQAWGHPSLREPSAPGVSQATIVTLWHERV